MAKSKRERKRQLDIALAELIKAGPTHDISLLGGDFNLRDREAEVCLEKISTKTVVSSLSDGKDLSEEVQLGSEVSCPTKVSKFCPVKDAWEICRTLIGDIEPEKKKFTWDCQKNNNKKMPGREQPRTRFDRLYIYTGDSEGQIESGEVYDYDAGNLKDRSDRISQLRFDLVGTDRLQHRRFPSDHFGILTEFHYLYDYAVQKGRSKGSPFCRIC